MKTESKPKTLQQAIQYFSDPEVCVQTVAELRWPDGVTCPACEGKEHYYLKTQRRWKCKECGRQFSVKLGTIFEDSAIGLDKWLVAFWLVANCKNGISSYELSRDLGVTQKTAWFMLHRIRLAMKNNSLFKIGGTGGSGVEVDETFVGGKVKNMHKDRRLRYNQQRGAVGKTVVMGMLDRDTREVRATVIPNVKRETLQTEVLQTVKYGSTVYTDSHVGYDKLHYRFVHEFVNHMEKYVDGQVHTNGIENFWSLLKRTLSGTYVAVEPFHMMRYVDEQVFRFNNRKDKTDSDRFDAALKQISGKRLTYAEVTGKVGETTF
jgi:transposase-like protein